MPMKFLSSVVICIAALLLFSQPVYANVTYGYEYGHTQEKGVLIDPLWDNVNNIRLGLTFSGNIANVSGAITGITGTTQISATFTLERQNANGTFSYVASWSTNANGRILTFSESRSPVTTSGNTYRLRVTAGVTRNGITEFISDSVTNRN
jgi:hypothetical protein